MRYLIAFVVGFVLGWISKSRDRYFWFGENSLWCKICTKWFKKPGWCLKKKPPDDETGLIVWENICTETGFLANKWCPNVEVKSFEAGKQPVRICGVHKKPDVPQWEGEVCKWSLKRPRKYCIHRKTIKKAEKPDLCDIEWHNVPDYPKRIKDYHAHFLGSFLAFQSRTWKTQDREYWEDQAVRTIREERLHGFDVEDGFLYLVSGRPEHKYHNAFNPWKSEVVGGKRIFDLDSWDEKWWGIFERWLEIHKLIGVHYCPHLAMSGAYNIYPFKNNKQGVRASRIWDESIRKYQKGLANRVISTFHRVYGLDYKPFIKICNEPAHHGSSKTYHDIMYYHEDIFESCLKEHTDKERVIIDLTGCEGSLSELREPHLCSKPGDCDKLEEFEVIEINTQRKAMRVHNSKVNVTVWTDLKTGAKKGDKFVYGWHGKPEYKREFIGEHHGYTTKKDFSTKVDGTDVVDMIIKSGNNYRKYTEDAGGWNKDGEGMRWLPDDPTPAYIFGSAKQQYEMALWMWNKIKNSNKPFKRIIYGSFPVETIQIWKEGTQTRFLPDYRIEVIDWDRFKMIQKAYYEVYGG